MFRQKCPKPFLPVRGSYGVPPPPSRIKMARKLAESILSLVEGLKQSSPKGSIRERNSAAPHAFHLSFRALREVLRGAELQISPKGRNDRRKVKSITPVWCGAREPEYFENLKNGFFLRRAGATPRIIILIQTPINSN